MPQADPFQIAEARQKAAEFSNLPTRSELVDAAGLKHDENVAFYVALEDTFVTAALMAPFKARAEMDPDESFAIVWDSGASKCISNDANDFIHKPRSAGLLTSLGGLATGMSVKGQGIVEWTVLDSMETHKF